MTLTEWTSYYIDDHADEEVLPFPDWTNLSKSTNFVTFDNDYYPATSDVDLIDRSWGRANNYNSISGGLFQITVRGVYSLPTAGGIVKWAREFIWRISRSNKGDLVVNNMKYTGSYFTGATFNFIRGAAAHYADYSLTFVRSSPKDSGVTEEGPTTDAPSEPDGTSEGQYTWGGVDVGDYAEIKKLTTSRQVVTKIVPRCYGARIRDPQYGQKAELYLDAWVRKTPDGTTNQRRANVEVEMQDFVHSLQQVTPGSSLTGEGHSIWQCRPVDFSFSQKEDWWTCPVGVKFQLDEISVFI